MYSMRVLLIHLEHKRWRSARGIAYTAGFAHDDALRARGVHVTSITTRWSKRIYPVLKGLEFDQIWVQIVHAKSLNEELFEWMADAAPIRVGFLQDSLEHDTATSQMIRPDLARISWKERVVKRAAYMTHVVGVDERDCEELSSGQGIPALWWPQAVPERFVCREIPPVNDPRAVFVGKRYAARQQLLSHPELQRHVWVRESLESETLYPFLFGLLEVTTRFLSAGGPAVGRRVLPVYMALLHRIREACFSYWLETLRGGSAVLNLPHIVGAYPGRVVEGMAAGRPVIAWRVPDRPRCAALFDEGEEILFYDREKPEQIVSHLERLAADSAFGQRVTENARDKILAFHTVEKRVEQILAWIEHGKEPVFC